MVWLVPILLRSKTENRKALTSAEEVELWNTMADDLKQKASAAYLDDDFQSAITYFTQASLDLLRPCEASQIFKS